jgi:hypothetical protein
MSDTTKPESKWVVWKYELPMANEFTLELPAQYRILSVQPQFGKYQMWVLNNAFSEKRPVLFCMVGTGQELPEPPTASYFDHLATIKQHDDMIVLHLFRVSPFPEIHALGVTEAAR